MHRRRVNLFATPSPRKTAANAGNGYQAPSQPASPAHKAILTEDGKVLLDEHGNAILIE